MTEANKDQALELLKLDLGISTTAYDNSLKGHIERALAAIEREGITLGDGDIDEQMLVVQYAAYMWRSRKGEDTGMPRSLRWDLNNRFIKENAGETEG